MAPDTNNNFYNPVASQANHQQPQPQPQPQGYTYTTHNNLSSATAQYSNHSSYQTSYGTNSYGTQYGDAAYGTAPSQPQPQSQSQSASKSARISSALSALTPQDFTSTAPAASSTSQNNNSTWNDSQAYSANHPTYHQSSRSQANPSPLYATSPASTFGRLSFPEQSSPQSSNTQHRSTAASNVSTQSSQNAPPSAASQDQQCVSAYTQQQDTQQPPDRYANPLHAVQAQQRQPSEQSHNWQKSTNSNLQSSPRIAARNFQQQLQKHQLQEHHHQQQYQHQQSASLEPSPTTVDPSQLYDFRAEQERKARIDAERRKKIEEEKAAGNAEEESRQRIEDARVAEVKRVALEQEKDEEDAKKAEEEVSRRRQQQQQQAREKKNEQRRKAREEKRQSKTAATALQQMAAGAGGLSGANGSSSNDGQAASMAMMAAMMGDRSQPPVNDEEAEMRAMFAKMREFNAKNPTLLAKMWEEERTAHAGSPNQPAVTPPLTIPATTANRGAGKPQQARQQPKTAPTAVGAPSTQPQQPLEGVNTAYKNGKAPVRSAAPLPAASSTSVWPPHKKGSLAEGAAKWLAGRPENINTGFTISSEEVLKILDTNPSYVQLCEMIEKIGVKFERSALAKELLKAVPDGLRNPTSGNVAATSPSNGMTAQMNAAAVSRKRVSNKSKNTYSVPNQRERPTANGTVSYQSSSFTSLTDAARAINGMNTAPAYPSGSLASALGAGAAQSSSDGSHFDQPVNIDDDDYQPVNELNGSAAGPVEIKPEEPPRPPADKEEAARKRTFGDLVDLTGGDDSDDEGPPRKMLQSQRPGLMPVPNAVYGPSLNSNQSAQQIVQQKFGTQNIGQPMQYDDSMQQNGYGRPNPLPSASATPVPPPQVVKSKGPSQEQLQHERMRGKMLVEPIMRDRVARKCKYDVRTIARDVLLATGRHPDMRALNAHLNSMQKLLGDHGGALDGAGNKSDLSTIKWAFIDPGEPANEAKAKVELENSDATEDADDESEQPTRTATPAAAKTLYSTNHPDKSSATQMRGSKGLNEDFIEPKKKRGRPKGFRPAFAKKEKEKAAQSAANGAVASSSKDATSFTSPTIDTTSPTRATRKRRTDSVATSARGSPANKDSSQNMSSGGAVGYAAFREIDENGNVIKKKGRPVGWRKNLHSREAQGLTPAKAGAKALGSKLRQSTTAAATSPAAVPLQRVYAVYACRWKGCKAELDGLERLKKHVLKIHGSANDDGDFECLWEGCKNHGKHVDGKERLRDGLEADGVGTFEDLERWLTHVDKSHLESVGWKLGDGMRGEAYETDSSLYLSDSAGRSLTPLIQPEMPRTNISAPGTHTSPSRQSRHGIIPLGRSKEELEAGKELEKLRRKKVEEGGLLGREGCRLVNEKRRRGFLDDEEFWDVVDDDDNDDNDGGGDGGDNDEDDDTSTF